MRGEIVYAVYGVHEGRSLDSHFGTYRTASEAEVAIARLKERHGPAWQERYHSNGFLLGDYSTGRVGR